MAALVVWCHVQAFCTWLFLRLPVWGALAGLAVLVVRDVADGGRTSAE